MPASIGKNIFAEYWFPENDSGSPEVETLGGDGPELNDNDQLKYFKNQLYKVSKIPLNRFDQESGETWFGADASSVARTEIDFGRFVTRLRNTFAQIMIKPLQLQLALSIPELQDNRQLLEAVSLQYKSYNLFEEMMDMEMMQKRADFIQSMKDGMVDMDKEGNEIKFFSSEFLVRKYLKLSDADLELNKKLKKEETERLKLAGSESGEDEGGSAWEGKTPDDMIDMIVERLNLSEEELEKKLKEIKNKKKKKTQHKSAEE